MAVSLLPKLTPVDQLGQRYDAEQARQQLGALSPPQPRGASVTGALDRTYQAQFDAGVAQVDESNVQLLAEAERLDTARGGIKQTYDQTRANLENQINNPDKTAMWLSVVQGLLAPGEPGSSNFAASIGRAAGNAVPQFQQLSTAKRDQEAQLRALRDKMATLEMEPNAAALARAKIASSAGERLMTLATTGQSREDAVRDANERARLQRESTQAIAAAGIASREELAWSAPFAVHLSADEATTMAGKPMQEDDYMLQSNRATGDRRIIAAAPRPSSTRGAEQQTPEQSLIHADTYGVPTRPPDSVSRLPPAYQAQARIKLLMDGQKELDKDADALKIAQGMAQDARSFMDANTRIATGGLARAATARGQASLLGNSDAQLMQSIAAKMVPFLRGGLPGAASDRDVEMFKAGGLGLDKNKAVNDAIARGMIVAAENASNYLDFRSSYFEVHGDLVGAEPAWRRYLAVNPIFDHSAGTPPYTPNASRQSYQEYFRGMNAAAQPAAVPAAAVPAAAVPARGVGNALLNAVGG